MGTHLGTQVDPPAHFIDNGATVDQIALKTLVGPVDIPAGEYEIVCLPLKISGADGAPARVILRG